MERLGCSWGCATPVMERLGCSSGCAIPWISSRVQDRLLRALQAHLSASPAVPEAGAATSGNTILLQVVLGEVTELSWKVAVLP